MQAKQNKQTKYSTQTEIQTLLVESEDLIASVNKITTDHDRAMARGDNFSKMLDELAQHVNINIPKSEKNFMDLMVVAEKDATGGVDEQSEQWDESYTANFMKSMLRHAHQHGLDERSVQIIQNAANSDQRLAAGSNSFKLPQEFRIQIRVMSIQALQRVVTIALYIGLFFVLYKIFF